MHSSRETNVDCGCSADNSGSANAMPKAGSCCKFAFSHVPPPEPMPDPEDMLTNENT